jgi:hypothetical protein
MVRTITAKYQFRTCSRQPTSATKDGARERARAALRAEAAKALMAQLGVTILFEKAAKTDAQRRTEGEGCRLF